MHNLFMKQFTPKVPSAIMGIYNSFLNPHKQGYIDIQHEVVYLRTETEGQAKRTWKRTYTAQHPLQMIWLFICEAQERKQLCIPWSPKHKECSFPQSQPCPFSAHPLSYLLQSICRPEAARPSQPKVGKVAQSGHGSLQRCVQVCQGALAAPGVGRGGNSPSVPYRNTSS